MEDGFTLPKLTNKVSVTLIAAEVRQGAAAGCKRQHDVCRNRSGEICMPDEIKELQHLLYVSSHQGVGGHRGRDTTILNFYSEVLGLGTTGLEPLPETIYID